MSVLDFVQDTPSLPDVYRTLSTEELHKRATAARETLGDKVYILGHHYQKDEVIRYADATGDSLQLSQIAADQTADAIIFCGVHFMAETADILTTPEQDVILPDLRAGCSMADMATISQTERAWSALQELFGDTLLPLTYVNSTAAIKSFVGKYGGATVTSSNAHQMVKWAFTQKPRLLFLPDQHLGRNTAADLGIALEHMAVWDPIRNELEALCPIDDIKVVLWKGHCSVHMNFLPKHVAHLRETEPERRILVHPECTHEVVQASDDNGSTSYIIQQIAKAPAGSKWAIGTEMNLVNRLIADNPHLDIVSLNPFKCPCLTMNRIDLPHLTWVLEELVDGRVVHPIRVNEETKVFSKQALVRMWENV